MASTKKLNKKLAASTAATPANENAAPTVETPAAENPFKIYVAYSHRVGKHTRNAASILKTAFEEIDSEAKIYGVLKMLTEQGVVDPVILSHDSLAA